MRPTKLFTRTHSFHHQDRTQRMTLTHRFSRTVLFLLSAVLMVSFVRLFDAAPAQAQSSSSWTCVYDFSTTAGLHGWTIVNDSNNAPIGSLTSTGIAASNATIGQTDYRKITIANAISVTNLTQVTVTLDLSKGTYANSEETLFNIGNSGTWVHNVAPSSFANGSNVQLIWNTSTAVASQLTIDLNISHGGWSGSALVKRVQLEGTGNAPCDPPELAWCVTWNFEAGPQEWTVLKGHVMATGLGAQQYVAGDPWRVISATMTLDAQLTEIELNYSAAPEASTYFHIGMGKDVSGGTYSVVHGGSYLYSNTLGDDQTITDSFFMTSSSTETLRIEGQYHVGSGLNFDGYVVIHGITLRGVGAAPTVGTPCNEVVPEPLPEWCVTWNFEAGPQEWTVLKGHAMATGLGARQYVSGDPWRVISATLPFDAQFTEIELDYSAAPEAATYFHVGVGRDISGGTYSTLNSGSYLYSNTLDEDQTISADGLYASSSTETLRIEGQYYVGSGLNYDGYVVIHGITLRGVGAAPTVGTPCNEVVPEPLPEWCVTWNFEAGPQEWTVLKGHAMATGLGAKQYVSGDTWRVISATLPFDAQFTEIELDYSAAPEAATYFHVGVGRDISGGTYSTLNSGSYLYSNTLDEDQMISADGLYASSSTETLRIEGQYYVGSGLNFDGYVVIHGITLRGVGAAPTVGTPCNEVVPEPLPEWCVTWNFEAGPQEWTVLKGHAMATGLGARQYVSGDPWRVVSATLTLNAHLTEIELDYSAAPQAATYFQIGVGKDISGSPYSTLHSGSYLYSTIRDVNQKILDNTFYIGSDDETLRIEGQYYVGSGENYDNHVVIHGITLRGVGAPPVVGTPCDPIDTEPWCRVWDFKNPSDADDWTLISGQLTNEGYTAEGKGVNKLDVRLPYTGTITKFQTLYTNINVASSIDLTGFASSNTVATYGYQEFSGSWNINGELRLTWTGEDSWAPAKGSYHAVRFLGTGAPPLSGRPCTVAEASVPLSSITPTPNVPITVTNSFELRYAINQANSVSFPVTINAAQGTYTFTGEYASGTNTALPAIANDITINGLGSGIRLENPFLYRFFYVEPASHLILNNVMLMSSEISTGMGTKGGGAIYVDHGDLTLNEVVIYDSASDNAAGGGAIYSDGGTLSITKSALLHTKAGTGAAIAAWNSDISIDHTIFSVNAAAQGAVLWVGGDADYPEAATITLTNNQIQYNDRSLIVNTTNRQVDARNNWWGTASSLASYRIEGNVLVSSPLSSAPSGLYNTSAFDEDGDGYHDLYDPNDADIDSDDDGLSDGEERVIHGTYYNVADSDSDGLNDYEEIFHVRPSNPLNRHSDTDHLDDGVERTLGLNPLVADTDGDTVSDDDEDTDDDGINNYDEIQDGTRPDLKDTDADGFDDNVDNCPIDENPTQADLMVNGVRDGIGDACDDDIDDDEIPNTDDNCPYLHNPAQGSGDCAGTVVPSSSSSTAIINKTQAVADGSDTITLTITLKDGSTNAPNVPVTIYPETPSSTLRIGVAEQFSSSYSGVTNGSGQLIVQVKNTAAQGRRLKVAVKDPQNGTALFTLTARDTATPANDILTFANPDVEMTLYGYKRMVAGDVLVYTMDVHNTSSAAASNVIVKAYYNLDGEVIDIKHTNKVVAVANGTRSLEWMIPKLEPNATERITFHVLSSARLQLSISQAYLAVPPGPDFIMTAEVIANDGTPENDESTISTDIEFVRPPVPADNEAIQDKFEVTYISNKPNAAMGETVRLTVKVKNTSSENLYNVHALAALNNPVFYSMTPVSAVNFVWPHPLEPHMLEPNDEVIGTFTYTMKPEFLQNTAAKRQMWVMARDSEPADGSLVAELASISSGDLAVSGAVVTAQLWSDRNSAKPGDTVNFTLRVSNDPNAAEPLEEFIVKNLLTDVTPDLADDLLPGQTVEYQFSYVVQADDAPQFNAMLGLSGSYATPQMTRLFEQVLTQTIAVYIPVVSITEPHADIVPSTDGNFPAFVLPTTDTQFPIRITNNGNLTAENVKITMTVPVGLIMRNTGGVDTDGDGDGDIDLTGDGYSDSEGIFVAAQHTLTYTLGSLAAQKSVVLRPVFASAGQGGAVIQSSVIVSTSTDETNTTNNILSITRPVVDPAPTVVWLTAVGDPRLAADGLDTLTLKIKVFDQLNRPLVNATGTIYSPSSKVLFDLSQITTDAQGEATVTIRTETPETVDDWELGAASIIASFGSTTETLTIERVPNALTLYNLDPILNEVKVGIGGSQPVLASLLNTTSKGDQFSISVTGDESNGFNPDWIKIPNQEPLPPSTEPRSLSLNLGQAGSTYFTVDLTGEECSLLGGLNEKPFPITVTAKGKTIETLASVNTTLLITKTPPVVDNIFPADNAKIGSEEVTFGWRSNTKPTSIVIKARLAGSEDAYLEESLVQSETDPTFYSATISLPRLNDTDTAYEWLGVMETDCGGIELPTRILTRTLSASFAKRAYDYEVKDNYDQTRGIDRTITPTPTTETTMNIVVRNHRSQPLSVRAWTEDVYPDLILGFVGLGSADSPIPVAANSTQVLGLRVFTQETTQTQYTLTLNLSVCTPQQTDLSDCTLVDRIPLTIRIAQQPFDNTTIALVNAETIDRTMVVKANLINFGLPVTDLNLMVVDQNGAPAPFIIKPDMTHVYIDHYDRAAFEADPLDLNPGKTIEIEIIPLDLVGVNSPNYIAEAGKTYHLRATSRWGVIEDVEVYRKPTEDEEDEPETDLSGHPVSAMCGAAQPVSAPERKDHVSSCVQMPGTITFESQGHYCSNTPNIDIALPWGLDSQTPIESVNVAMDFTPYNASDNYSHLTRVYFNNVYLDEKMVPTDEMSFQVPLSAIVPGARTQTFNLRSQHNNEAHYIVANNATVTVSYGSYESAACYSAEELEVATMLPCSDGTCYPDLTASRLTVTRQTEDKTQLDVTVLIGNGGKQATLAANDIIVSFYNGHPDDGQLIATDTIENILNPGEEALAQVTLSVTDTALPLYVVVDDDGTGTGAHLESSETNNIYRTSTYLTADLRINGLSMTNVYTNVNSLLMNGSVLVEIASPVIVNKPFKLTVFEDTNHNEVFNPEVDVILGQRTIENLMANTPRLIDVSVNGYASFAGNLVYAMVDSDNAILETNENNNVQSNLPCLAQTGDCQNVPSDLSVSALSRSVLTDANDDVISNTLRVRVGNGGGKDIPATTLPEAVIVTFYAGEVGNAAHQLGLPLEFTGGLESSEYLEASLTLTLAEMNQRVSDGKPLGPLSVTVSGAGIAGFTETTLSNNQQLSGLYLRNSKNRAPVVSVLPTEVTLRAPRLTTTLTATTSDPDAGDTVSVRWQVTERNGVSISNASSYGISFGDSESPNTPATFGTEGVYTVRLTATDGAASSTATLTVTVLPPPPLPQRNMAIPGCLVAPESEDTMRSPYAAISAPWPIKLKTGIALTDVAVFAWQINNAQNYRLLAELPSADADDTLAIFDTTLFANDIYAIQVTGKETVPNANQDPQVPGDETIIVNRSCGTAVRVTGENKPGRVTLAMTDFTVPIVGLPITIGRAYDSLERDYIGDFGYGWALTMSGPRMEVAPDSTVTLTLPDGKRRTFGFAAELYDFGFFGGLGIGGAPTYYPEPGEYGSFRSENSCPFANLAADGRYYCFLGGGGALYEQNVTAYIYNDPYGREFTFSPQGKLTQIKDLNGNILTFSRTGISSNSGVNVTFVRDANNSDRITSIIAPDGKTYKYEYDAFGDLVKVIFPPVTVGSTTQTYDNRFTYYTNPGWEHLLHSGIDAKGNVIATMKYTDDGRLASVTDILKTTSSYSYNIAANTTVQVTYEDLNNNGTMEPTEKRSQTTTVTDSMGNVVSSADGLDRVTTSVYEGPGKGNLKSTTQILNGVEHTTSYTYDAKGNRTSTKNADGKVVMAMGYNQYGGPSSFTDATGHTYSVSYGPTFMPASMGDSLGVVGSFEWLPKGSLKKRTDANGEFIEYTYDDYGNVTSEKDTLGRTTTYEYYPDKMGRVKSVTDAAGLKTEYTYDALGRTTSVTTPGQGTTSYTYDANGNKLSETLTYVENGQPVTRTTDYTYDALNRVIRVEGPLVNGARSKTETTYNHEGKTLTQKVYFGTGANDFIMTCYAYDAAGQTTSMTSACGTADAATTQYQYDALGRQIGVIDPMGRRTDSVYNKAGQLIETIRYGVIVTDFTTSVTGAVKEVTEYTYNDAGQRTRTRQINNLTDSFDVVTEYVYDVRGGLKYTIFADGTKTETVYDAAGEQIMTIDPMGLMTRTDDEDLRDGSNNILGELKKTTIGFGTALQQTQTSFYDKTTGRLMWQTDASGLKTSRTYNTAGQVQTVTVGEGANAITTTYAYDARGQQKSITDAKQHVTGYTYDAMGRLITTTQPDETVSTTDNPTIVQTYDLMGRLLSSADQNNNTTAYTYDAAGRLWTVTNGEDETVEYAYYKDGQLKSIMDGEGNLTSFEYDAFGRQSKKIQADDTFETFTYDRVGNMIRHTWSNANLASASDDTVHAFYYDAMNRMVRAVYPEGRIDFTYTLRGSLETVTDATSRKTYTYDVLGRPVSVTTVTMVSGVEQPSTSQTVAYTYNAANNRTSLVTPAGTTTYTYDALNRLQTVTDAQNGVTSYTYDPVGLLETITQPNGIISTYGYNSRNLLTSLTHVKAAPQTPLATFTYTYDDAGQRETATEVIGNDTRSVTWTYDDANRLLSEATSLNSVSSTTSYTYDDAGNRDTSTFGGITKDYEYNDLNQLTQVTWQAANGTNYKTEYTYDARGNQIEEEQVTGLTTTGVKAFTFDSRNRLTGVSGMGASATYTYDPIKNHRVSATSSGLTTRFVWDEFTQFGDVLYEMSGTSNTVQMSYTYGLTGLLSQMGSGAGSTRYRLTDAQGSTRLLTNAAGAVTSSYVYDAFGTLQSQGTPETKYLYTGQQFDQDTGLYSLRARYYNPGAGRFLSMDTWAYNLQNPFELNRYVYVANNPVMYADPTGYTLGEAGNILRSIARTTMVSATRLGAKGSLLYMRAFIALMKASIPLTGGICLAISFAVDGDTGLACDTPVEDLLKIAGEGIKSFRRLIQADADNALAVTTNFIRNQAAVTPGLGSFGGNQKNISVAQMTINNVPLNGWIWGISGKQAPVIEQFGSLVRQISGPADRIGAYIDDGAKYVNDHAEKAVLGEIENIVSQGLSDGSVKIGDHIHISLYTERAPCSMCGGVIWGDGSPNSRNIFLGIEGVIAERQTAIQQLGVTVSIDVLFSDPNKQTMQGMK